MRHARRTPDQILCRALILAFAVFLLVYSVRTWDVVNGSALTPAVIAFIGLKTAIEVLAGAYGIAFALNAGAYIVCDHAAPLGSDTATPSIGLIYLCCDDADARAVKSLATLTYPGPIHLVIHDDSATPAGAALIGDLADEMSRTTSFCVQLLRRPDRSGGKAAAVNYVLERTAHLFEFFLLCDNDSTVVDPLTIQKALQRVGAPAVAVVQLRPLAIVTPTICGVNRLLSRSITAFHAFLLPCSRFGWMPFIGHNALLRTAAVLEVGGLTPGFFSDDLDLTVRLNLAGYDVVYAPEIVMGETHPPSYAAFRRRSYKWAYGCVQTLKAHTLPVLRSSGFTLAEKISFLQFGGFYVLQAVLLVYLLFAFVIGPFLLPSSGVVDVRTSAIAGSIVVLLVYAPVLAYVIKEGRDGAWFAALLLCGLVYGGTDFSVARGVWDGAWGRTRRWTPTNAGGRERRPALLLAEAAFGVMLLAGPLLTLPAVLYLPCSYLFAGKFLFGPALSLLYQDETSEHEPRVAPDVFDPPGHSALRMDA